MQGGLPSARRKKTAPGWMRSILFLRRQEFQKIANFAFQNGADAGQNIDVQSGDVVVTVVVDLRTLHFCPVTEFVLADTCFLDQFIQFDTNGSILFHTVTSMWKGVG